MALCCSELLVVVVVAVVFFIKNILYLFSFFFIHSYLDMQGFAVIILILKIDVKF